MSIRAVVRSILVCDRCGLEHGDGAGVASPMEARAAAYADGWRFPNRKNVAGKTLKNTFDLCQTCAERNEPAPKEVSEP